jgi:hypothetical protein
MADYDRKPDTSIIGRDADAADGADPIEQVTRPSKEDAGGNIRSTAPLECGDFDIIFEQEDFQGMRH